MKLNNILRKRKSGTVIIMAIVLVLVMLSVVALFMAFAFMGDRSGAMSGSGIITEENEPDVNAPVIVTSGPCSERIIKIASEGVGTHETTENQGPRNNPPKTQGITNDYKHGRFDGQPWCAYFASWVLQSAGDGIPTIASAIGIYNYYVGKGQAYSPESVRNGTNTPQAGDIFVKQREGGNHVGIVTGYSNGTVYTIEGNSSNKVRSGKQSLSKILGFGRPQCK